MILRRLPDSRFSEVLPAWKGGTAFLLGGGPSLTVLQVDAVRIECEAGRGHCIAINDAYLLAPWADVLYAADAAWHNWHTAGVAKPLLGLSKPQVAALFAHFRGQKCSIESQVQNIEQDETHVLRNAYPKSHGTGMSLDPQAIVTGRNSGHQAVNVAILAGVARIILLGFDGRADPKTGATHWHGGHPREQVSPSAFADFRRAWSASQNAIAATGVRIINCSPGTFIDTFEKMPLEQALELATA